MCRRGTGRRLASLTGGIRGEHELEELSERGHVVASLHLGPVLGQLGVVVGQQRRPVTGVRSASMDGGR